MPPEQKKRARRRSQPSADTVHQIAERARQLPLPPPFAPDRANGGQCEEPIRILTIGHSNHEPGHFLALLRQHGLQTLVDVRSAPYSRYAPHFNRQSLDALLAGAGIHYQWAGDALGGRPEDPACYREGVVRPGEVDYAAVARQPWYRAGVQNLLDVAALGVTAIMCSEEDPRRCHRRRLIEPSLREKGVTVLHVRRDGSLETIEADEGAIPETAHPQLALTGFDA